MASPEGFSPTPPDSDEEQERLKQIEAAAEAARRAGVYDPSDLEDGE